MEEAKGQFEWSESGKELLLHFEAIIRQHGGLQSTHDLIISEMNDNLFMHKHIQLTRKAKTRGYQHFTPEEDQYIKDNWFKKSLAVLAIDLNRNDSSVRNRGMKLGFFWKQVVKEGGNKNAA